MEGKWCFGGLGVYGRFGSVCAPKQLVLQPSQRQCHTTPGCAAGGSAGTQPGLSHRDCRAALLA